ncbi:UNVERIFIED_CONTAM: Tumor necrosis factor-inducible protein 6 protein [Gekko kuhli]
MLLFTLDQKANDYCSREIIGGNGKYNDIFKSLSLRAKKKKSIKTFNCFSFTERAAGVYHREGRNGKYQLTYAEAKAVCEYEGGHLATYQQLEAARKIGFHMCAAGWLAKGRVGYPIVKPGSNCGFGKTGIVDYGFRLNRSERWDAYCYNPNGKDCGGVFTNSQHIFKTPGYPNEYENDQICYWHIRVKYGQQVQIQFVDFDLEEDTSCMSDYLEIYDSYDDVNGFVGRYCGDELPDPVVSTGNVMTLKFLSDASVTAGGFQIKYVALDPPKKSAGKNATTQSNTNYLAGKFVFSSPDLQLQYTPHLNIPTIQQIFS